MAKVVILGAGLTGLSSAYHLEQNNFLDYKIFEKNNTPGGLCSSVVEDGFTFDYTGHLLHINDDYFKEFIEDVLGLENLDHIARKSYIYSHDTFTNYPFQTNLYGLPADVIVECIEGFLLKKSNLKPKSFYDWVLKHFGAGMGKHFMFPYQEKLFSYDIKKVMDNWTGRFVPSTSLRSIIEGSVNKKDEKIGYNSSFYYPKSGGISKLPNSIAKKLTQPIHTGYEVVSVDIKNKVVEFSNGHSESYDQLISTLPLDKFIEKTHGLSSVSIKSHKLLCNSVLNFNLGINIHNLTHKHWIYFPEKKYSFYRVGFWSNFSSLMAKSGCSSMYGEFSYMPKTKTKVQLRNQVKKCIKQLMPILGISEQNIILEKNLHLNHAYVIYDKWREKNLSKLHNKLNELSIHSVGRFGEWKYSSMQEAVLDGKKVAGVVMKPLFHGATKTVIEEKVIRRKRSNDLIQR